MSSATEGLGPSWDSPGTEADVPIPNAPAAVFAQRGYDPADESLVDRRERLERSRAISRESGGASKDGGARAAQEQVARDRLAGDSAPQDPPRLRALRTDHAGLGSKRACSLRRAR